MGCQNSIFKINHCEKMKDQTQSEEFYVPPQGLDLDFYLGYKLPLNATKKQVRARKQAIHHLSRYYWAIEVLKELKNVESWTNISVLDIACGSGYGSYLLALSHPDLTIIGADYDARSIAYATQAYSCDNLSYRQFDMVTWSSVDNQPLGEIDVVVSFDTIEHLLHREIALVNIAENLSAGGYLFFSTPTKRENLLTPGWEHHKIEYSAAYLENVMKRFFADIRSPRHASFPCIDFWRQKVNCDQEEYLLRYNPLLCSKPIQYCLQGISEQADLHREYPSHSRG